VFDFGALCSGVGGDLGVDEFLIERQIENTESGPAKTYRWRTQVAKTLPQQ
jgi:hypothetical protein